MQASEARIEQVAPTDATVLILGESGTGKELVARSIHRAEPARQGPFLARELRGDPRRTDRESSSSATCKGGFTGAVADRAGVFETADQGTLFLDEIGDMPLSAQAKLLRVLETGEFVPVGRHRASPVGHAGGRGHQP